MALLNYISLFISETVLSTMTAIIPTGDITNGGFLPINGAQEMSKPSLILVLTIGFLYIIRFH